MENYTQGAPAQESSAPKKSKLPYFIAAGLIVLFAAAAFVAMRHFSGQKKVASPLGLGHALAFSGLDGFQQAFQLNIRPAEELPKTQPETMGMYVERKDNSIFIGTGDITAVVTNGDGTDSEPQIDASYSGDKVEVVVSNDTIVYRDTTQLNPENPEEEVQQTVELSTIDDITPQSSITVWGRKAGDRIIADTLLFHSPFAFSIR
ncbi:MAG: hypothetical protein LDL51_09085 [Chloroflexi bacterium]|nr:hypothetical protein [Chloroflexota bacterium]